MYKNCNTEESALRQQQLEECLLNNMLIKPYSDISVSDLCQQAGISRKSFYRYFGNKDGCLNALLDRVLLEATRFRYSSKPAVYPQELSQSLAYWKQQKPLLDSLTENALTIKLLERACIHTINEEKGFLQLLGAYDIAQDSDRLLFAITGYITLIINWNTNGYPKSLEEMTETLMQLMTKPLLKLPGAAE